MSGLVTVLGAVALALVAPGAVYLAALTAAAASPTRREGDQARRGQPGDGGGGAPVRVVIVVPAHDESKGILRTLRRLQAEVVDDAQARIVVVADNCSDDTAAVALAGVDVLSGPIRRIEGGPPRSHLASPRVGTPTGSSSSTQTPTWSRISRHDVTRHGGRR